MKFSYLDIFLIAGLCLGGFLGYRGGLAKKLYNILILILAVIVASKLMTPVGHFFSDAGVLGETAAYAVGFALVMLAIMIPALLLYRRFGKTGGAKTTGNTIGLFLGVLEGAMVISFILIGLKVIDTPDADDRQASLLYKPLANFVPKTFELLQSYLPGAAEFKKQVQDKFRDLDIFAKPPEAPRNP
ncbi:MAG TPA: CvpA family protein [Bacteroidota bacterium]|nr:CvpA family protein [Bacteroidota bacterium]